LLTPTDPLILYGEIFQSRLLLGTSRYPSPQVLADAVKASQPAMLTASLRRQTAHADTSPAFWNLLKDMQVPVLPNTAGCFTAEDALRTLRLAREAGGWDLVKLEVLADQNTLYPDMVETLRATEVLVKEGFKVMVYCTDDPIMCRRLEDLGVVAIMPLGAPIGSGLGIQNQLNIHLIVEQSKLPVLVDAGVGTASHAAVAMELGCAGVLMNTAIACADNPILMAEAMKHAVIAGRQAFLAGRMAEKQYGSPSSPVVGKINA
jgi:thiazole synthase